MTKLILRHVQSAMKLIHVRLHYSVCIFLERVVDLYCAKVFLNCIIPSYYHNFKNILPRDDDVTVFVHNVRSED